MTTNLKFIKLANKWFVHLPEYDLGGPEDLEMVMGADILCECLDFKGRGIIDVEICTDSEEIINKNDFLTLNLLNSTGDDGANYQVTGKFQQDIWLCNVTKYVFNGNFPATIYINIL